MTRKSLAFVTVYTAATIYGMYVTPRSFLSSYSKQEIGIRLNFAAMSEKPETQFA